MEDFHRLYDETGYRFKKVEHLKLALTHRSMDGPNNERLEFLGDSLLNFFVADLLYKKFPDFSEGDLSQLRASLVRGQTLVKIALAFDLGRYVLLGVCESKSGGHQRRSILENTLEALIGAIYLDSGAQACQHVVTQWFLPLVENVSLSNPAYRDSKSQLQELLQSKSLVLPTYEILRTEGPEHGQTFFVRCVVPQLSCQAEASGQSRKQAEQACAEILLNQLSKTITAQAAK